jgi:putative phosphoribosyl transferase
MIFRDRTEAGRRLAKELATYAQRADVVVLGLPRGGIPVAYEVARRLEAPLDVFVVRKLGLPGQEELAIGAIASGGVRVLNEDLLARLRVPRQVVDQVAAQEEVELARRERAYRGPRGVVPVSDRVAILVDDGLATGASMRAAAMALRRLNPVQVVVAVPVGAAETCAEFGAYADEVICAETPEPFWAVGNWYDDFSQTTDEEVRELLELARRDEEERDARRPRLRQHAS